jgi:hypothetical protein
MVAVAWTLSGNASMMLGGGPLLAEVTSVALAVDILLMVMVGTGVAMDLGLMRAATGPEGGNMVSKVRPADTVFSRRGM